MARSLVNKVFEGSVGVGAITSGDVTTEGDTRIAILAVMDNATSAGDIGPITLNTYDGERPQALVGNLSLNSAYTLGPVLTGPVSQKITVFDVSPFVECQYNVTNSSGLARNLKIFVYQYSQ